MIEGHESLWGGGGVVVKYSKTGEVFSSDYNHQYVEQMEREKYEDKYGKEVKKWRMFPEEDKEYEVKYFP